MTIRKTVIDSIIGELTLVADENALTGLYFPGHWHLPPVEAFGPRVDADSDPFLADVRVQVTEYLSGSRDGFEIPVSTHGDEFQEKVWAILREIPRGETTSYGAIAERFGNKSLAQSVGQAVGHNPVSIVIPCHRVIGANGRLTGFAGGITRKKFLLELEEPATLAAERLF